MLATILASGLALSPLSRDPLLADPSRSRQAALEVVREHIVHIQCTVQECDAIYAVEQGAVFEKQFSSEAHLAIERVAAANIIDVLDKSTDY